MVVISLDQFVEQQTWWTAYCPRVHHLQVIELDPSEAELPEGIQTFPYLPSASTSFGAQEQDNVADRSQGQKVVTVQIGGEHDKESDNERAEREVPVLTEKDLKDLESTTSAALAADDSQHGLFIQPQPSDQFGTTTTSSYLFENSPANPTETAEPILIAQEKMTPIDELVENSEVIATTRGTSTPTSLTPKSTAAPSAIMKTSPSSEVTKSLKDIKVRVKELKKLVRFMRKFNAKSKSAKKANRKRKATEAGGGGESKPEAGPSQPKQRKQSTRNRPPAVVRPTTSTVKVPSVRKFKKRRYGKNLGRLPKSPPPPNSVAKFFGKSASGSLSVSPSIPATLTEIRPEMTGSKPGTPDLDLDFDSFGNKMEGGKDFFDGLLGDLPDVDVDLSEIINLSCMDDGDIPEIIDLVLD